MSPDASSALPTPPSEGTLDLPSDADLASLEERLNALGSLGSAAASEVADDQSSDSIAPTFAGDRSSQSGPHEDSSQPSQTASDEALQLQQSVADAVSGAEPQVDTKPPGETDASLRSQLAEMFGMDVGSLESSTIDPSDEATTESTTRTVDDGEQSEGDLPAFRFDREEALSSQPVEPVSFLPPPDDPQPEGAASEPLEAASDTAAPPTPPAPEPTNDTSPATGGDDDSVAAYMERLLARSRGTAPSSPPPKAEKPSPEQAPPAPPSPVSEAVPSPSEAVILTPRDRRVRKPVNKEQLRQEVSSLRALALASSRAAVAKSRRKYLKMQVISKSVVAGMAALVSAVLIASPYWSRESFLLWGVLGIVPTGVFLYQLLQTVQTYRRVVNETADEVTSVERLAPVSLAGEADTENDAAASVALDPASVE